LKNIFCSNLMLLPFESFHRIKCLALWKNQPTYSQLDLYHYHKFFWYQCCLEDKLEWNRKVHFMGNTWQSFSVNIPNTNWDKYVRSNFQCIEKTKFFDTIG
jgi:hypothetical protein